MVCPAGGLGHRKSSPENHVSKSLYNHSAFKNEMLKSDFIIQCIGNKIN